MLLLTSVRGQIEYSRLQSGCHSATPARRCPYQETKVLSTAVHTSFSRRSGLRVEMSSLSQPVAAKSRASA